MKSRILLLILLSTLNFGKCAYSQAYDIGIDFKKQGYLRNINYNKKEAIIDFVDDKKISTELVKLNNSGNFTDVRPGISIGVEGEYFRKTETNIVKKITHNKDYNKKIKIENGRIDGIEKDYAYIDGYKVKLKEGLVIKGINGYNKKFESINQLLLGDIVQLKGYYDTDGFVYADTFSVEPDIETENDKKAKSAGGSNILHNELYPIWTNKSRRKQLLGKPNEKLGEIITNSDVLQEYIQNLGMKLIPDHVKAKIKYIFIVVDNDENNAYALPNGIVVVNTGLLKLVETEAQLVSTLGHELAHSIYEHSAERIDSKIKASENIFKIDNANKVYNLIDKKVLPSSNSFKDKDKFKIDAQSSKVLLNYLPVSALKKGLSQFSIENESQADRVGLYLLVRAGYDPREAINDWVITYNFSGGSWKIKTESYFDNAINDLSNSNVRKPTKNLLAAEVIKSLATTKTTNNLKQSKNTHPYDLERYEELNDMTYLFWSSPNILNNCTTGINNWQNLWEKIRIESKRK